MKCKVGIFFNVAFRFRRNWVRLEMLSSGLSASALASAFSFVHSLPAHISWSSRCCVVPDIKCGAKNQLLEGSLHWSFSSTIQTIRRSCWHFLSPISHVSMSSASDGKSCRFRTSDGCLWPFSIYFLLSCVSVGFQGLLNPHIFLEGAACCWYF